MTRSTTTRRTKGANAAPKPARKRSRLQEDIKAADFIASILASQRK